MNNKAVKPSYVDFDTKTLSHDISERDTLAYALQQIENKQVALILISKAFENVSLSDYEKHCINNFIGCTVVAF